MAKNEVFGQPEDLPILRAAALGLGVFFQSKVGGLGFWFIHMYTQT